MSRAASDRDRGRGDGHGAGHGTAPQREHAEAEASHTPGISQGPSQGPSQGSLSVSRAAHAEYTALLDVMRSAAEAGTAVSIGALVDGIPVAGIVMHGAREEVFTATRGGGAYCNGQRITVSTITQADATYLARLSHVHGHAASSTSAHLSST
jgi:hypothetical protein